MREMWVGTGGLLCDDQPFSFGVENPERQLVLWDEMDAIHFYANRYHRYRQVNGKLFQGRFKSLVVEEAAIWGLFDHIHLNPVRQEWLVWMDCLVIGGRAFWYLNNPSKRPSYLPRQSMLDWGWFSRTQFGA